MCKGLSGRTLLHHACQVGHFDVVKYLTDEQQFNPSCQDENGTTPLHLASRFGTLETVKFLTDEKHCDPLCRNKSGDTPLHWAALGEGLDVLKFFISEKHCDPMCKGQFGRTPLHHASQEGNLDMVKYLTDEQNINPSCQDENGAMASVFSSSVSSSQHASACWSLRLPGYATVPSMALLSWWGLVPPSLYHGSSQPRGKTVRSVQQNHCLDMHRLIKYLL